MAYAWDFMNDEVKRRAATMPREGALAFLELMAAAELNPWGIGLRPGERRELNMPNVPFGPAAQGIVTYLIDDFDLMLWVTDVTWAG